MKRTKFNSIGLSLLVATGLTIGACDVTDQTPVTLVPEEEAFADPARVLGNVLGVYDAAQRGFFLGAIQRGYPFGAASIQQGDMRAGDMYNDQLFYEITYIGAHTPATANNAEFWSSIYRLINRANVVLAGLDQALENGVITQEAFNGFRGEMLTIRAHAHFELLLHVSRPYSSNPQAMGIPYRDFAVNVVNLVDEAIQVDRGTVAGVYERVLEDLNEAEQLGGGPAPLRVSPAAAIALKSRVFLHKEEWASVIEEYEKLQGQFSLTPTPEVPFTSPRQNTESIFSYNNTPESNPGVNGALAAMYGNPQLGGRGLVKISPFSWNWDFWHPEDSRRSELTTQDAAGIYTAKYTGYIDRDDPAPMFRYAEVVLNAAEAHARLGNLNEALELLNSVRDRALPASVPSYTLAAVGGDAMGLLDHIWKERRIEFLAEGIRWYDIHRLSGRGDLDGIPPKAPSRAVTSIAFYDPNSEEFQNLGTDHALPFTSDSFLWPIPLQEVANNPVLAAQQNPGF
ncbi:RagB/SusD domain protein [Nitritalea halalkaliphila LW7]|uniref:RagB/SusD domain protein n=1 Tax=Nitritalea halalkaliphila LW7 TaxID=1189621 RepID=I5C1L4_9BACT|nr:RagB/SusD family nutrient uptake outer membrane protein [Nitritalea halalkaliphila]EIM75716.1 RagB/SusD domain protein [Nitritalea halalkaliphila LW7]